MTRLPVDTWLATPRLDLPPYELNTICPVTGETSGLEDHHIFRRSFTALGKDNEDLYWVEIHNGEKKLLRNRVALSPEAHQRITTNAAHLEYRGVDLFYVEGEEEKKLDLNLKLMAPGEKVSKRRKKASTPEERKARKTYTINTPAEEENILPELEDAIRDKYAEALGWSSTVPAYFVWTLAGAKALQ